MVLKVTFSIPAKDPFENYPAVLRMRDQKRDQKERLKEREQEFRLGRYDAVDHYPTILRMREEAEERHPPINSRDDQNGTVIQGDDNIRESAEEESGGGRQKSSSSDVPQERQLPDEVAPDEKESNVEKETLEPLVPQEVASTKESCSEMSLLKKLQKDLLTLLTHVDLLGIQMFTASWKSARNYTSIAPQPQVEATCRDIVLWEPPMEAEHLELLPQPFPTMSAAIFVNMLNSEIRKIFMRQVPKIYFPTIENSSEAEIQEASKVVSFSRRPEQQVLMLPPNENFMKVLMEMASKDNRTQESMVDSAVRGIRSMLSTECTWGDEKSVELGTITAENTAAPASIIPEEVLSTQNEKSQTSSWLEGLLSLFERFTVCH